jgi:hypothetical protein
MPAKYIDINILPKQGANDYKIGVPGTARVEFGGYRLGAPVGVNSASTVAPLGIEEGVLGDGVSYIGFTAATGSGLEEHRINQFTFSSNNLVLADISTLLGSINYVGAAVTNTGQIRLNPSTGGVGAAWCVQPLRYKYADESPVDWSVWFEMAMGKVGGAGPADGICFVLQSQSTNVGGAGGGIGYGGIGTSVAIEFDTWYNAEGGDQAVPHTAIDVNGAMNSSSLSSTPVGFALQGGATMKSTYVWIDYVSGVLTVRLAQTNTRPGSAHITRTINLATYLDH